MTPPTLAARGVQRMRQSARPVTLNENTHPAASDVTFIDVNAPSAVDAGESFTFTATVENTAALTEIHPDFCSDGFGGIESGFLVETQAAFQGVPGTDSGGEACINRPGVVIGPGTHTFSFQLTAPDDPGPHDLQTTALGGDSGLIFAETFHSIEVVGDDPEPPEPPDPEPPEPEPPDDPDSGPWVELVRVLREVVTTVRTGIETIGETLRYAVSTVRELLTGLGAGLRDLVFRAFDFVSNNPLLLAVLILAVFGVAPALGDLLVSLSPPALLLDILPFVGN